MQFYDTVVLDGVRKTRDGYLVGVAKSARTGIQVYTGREVDPDNEHGMRDRAMVRVYRSPEEVFHRDAMASMAHRPVTVDHPGKNVDSKNWKKLSGGITGGEVVRDGDFVAVPLTLMDQGAIDAWEGGKRELSWGYACEIDFTDGQTPTGEAYDAIQRTIRANHLALCDRARGGDQLRLGDEDPSNRGGPDVPLKTIIVDGQPLETTDAGEAAINKKRGLLDTAGAALKDANAAHATAMAAKDAEMGAATAAHTQAIAAKDAELGKKDAEIADLQKQIVTGDALDALVADRAAVTAKAKSIAPTLDTAGKSNAEIKRAAVAAKLGDEKVKDKSDDYVGALFDHLATDGAADTNDGGAGQLRDPIRDSKTVKDAQAAAEDAWKKSGDDLNAWRKPKAA